MRVDYHSAFVKDFKKLKPAQQRKAEQRVAMFIDDPAHTLLRDHGLSGKYTGYRSIRIGGDLRIIYKRLSKNHVVLARIGTHSQLYN